MTHKTTRRDFIKNATIVSSTLLFPEVLFGLETEENGFSLIDYHVHLTNTFTIEKAIEISKNINVKFGIVEHPGMAAGINTDEDLSAYIDKLRQYPVYVGIQPVYRNWSQNFSNRLISQLDFVLMDADTIPLGDGQYLEIWRHNNYIEDVDEFMVMYMKHIEDILVNEPITIFARPTYLPVNFARYYDEIWTEQRMMQIITLAKEKNIALEISTPMHVPSRKFINLAKANGCKFTMGTNARNSDAGKLHYAISMIKDCNLSPDDFLILG
jgi:histidinol phosphatase-like PHP family hydrolase